jgi:DNA-binding XRE family transcriptional regulator
MTPEQFTRWRALLDYNKSDAAQALGCSPNSITAWESGQTRIPRYIALACRALANDLLPWGEERR